LNGPGCCKCLGENEAVCSKDENYDSNPSSLTAVNCCSPKVCLASTCESRNMRLKDTPVWPDNCCQCKPKFGDNVSLAICLDWEDYDSTALDCCKPKVCKAADCFGNEQLRSNATAVWPDNCCECKPEFGDNKATCFADSEYYDATNRPSCCKVITCVNHFPALCTETNKQIKSEFRYVPNQPQQCCECRREFGQNHAVCSPNEYYNPSAEKCCSPWNCENDPTLCKGLNQQVVFYNTTDYSAYIWQNDRTLCCECVPESKHQCPSNEDYDSREKDCCKLQTCQNKNKCTARNMVYKALGYLPDDCCECAAEGLCDEGYFYDQKAFLTGCCRKKTCENQHQCVGVNQQIKKENDFLIGCCECKPEVTAVCLSHEIYNYDSNGLDCCIEKTCENTKACTDLRNPNHQYKVPQPLWSSTVVCCECKVEEDVYCNTNEKYDFTAPSCCVPLTCFNTVNICSGRNQETKPVGTPGAYLPDECCQCKPEAKADCATRGELYDAVYTTCCKPKTCANVGGQCQELNEQFKYGGTIGDCCECKAKQESSCTNTQFYDASLYSKTNRVCCTNKTCLNQRACTFPREYVDGAVWGVDGSGCCKSCNKDVSNSVCISRGLVYDPTNPTCCHGATCINSVTCDNNHQLKAYGVSPDCCECKIKADVTCLGETIYNYNSPTCCVPKNCFNTDSCDTNRRSYVTDTSLSYPDNCCVPCCAHDEYYCTRNGLLYDKTKPNCCSAPTSCKPQCPTTLQSGGGGLVVLEGPNCTACPLLYFYDVNNIANGCCTYTPTITITVVDPSYGCVDLYIHCTEAESYLYGNGGVIRVCLPPLTTSSVIDLDYLTFVSGGAIHKGGIISYNVSGVRCGSRTKVKLYQYTKRDLITNLVIDNGTYKTTRANVFESMCSYDRIPYKWNDLVGKIEITKE